MSKPSIPLIDQEAAVIDWFLKYDEKIKGYFDPPPSFIMNLPEQLKAEMLANLKEHHDAQSLQGFVKKIADFYSKLVPELALIHEYAEKGKIPADLPPEQAAQLAQYTYMEISLTTKMRVLGYFLLKKYDIKPE